jgi:hypothetical protein
MACRGSGRVISNLGGTPSEVACPWCRGSGTRIPGIDAQEEWRARHGEEAQGDAAEPQVGAAEPHAAAAPQQPQGTAAEAQSGPQGAGPAPEPDEHGRGDSAA